MYYQKGVDHNAIRLSCRQSILFLSEMYDKKGVYDASHND